jgi:hypothetical protein
MKTIATWILMTALMTALALLFVEGLERQEFIDQAKRAAHMDTLLYPEPQSTYHPKPTDMATPKTKVFQDASQDASRKK